MGQFDKISNTSSEHLLGIIGEEDLAKDMGMFNFDLDGLNNKSSNKA